MGEPARKQRVRLDAADRRLLLLEHARATFAARGYAASGLAEIAQRAGVSKTLLYHYFPDGRPELFRVVVGRLVDDLTRRIRDAVRAPVDADARTERVVDAFFGFVEDEPDGYRLIFLEPWGAGDARVVGLALGARMRLSGELAGLLSSTGARLEAALAASAGSVGALLHIAELHLAGQVGRDTAVDVAVSLLRGARRELAASAVSGPAPATPHH